jgi:N-acetylglutamate synthase/N-acetylornithine aminotransferase
MTAETARLVGCPVEQVLVSSTGVSASNLPMDKVRAGLPAAFGALGADQGRPRRARS